MVPARALRSFRGRPLLINVWLAGAGRVSGNGPSWRGSPGKARDFAIIGISTDDYADKADGLLKSSNATSVITSTMIFRWRTCWAHAFALTVLVDANGRILQKVYGARQWDGADALRLLADAFHEQLRPR